MKFTVVAIDTEFARNLMYVKLTSIEKVKGGVGSTILLYISSNHAENYPIGKVLELRES